MIGVDKVQPDCGVADKELALFWFANLDLLPFENGGGTGFVDADGVGHFNVNLSRGCRMLSILGVSGICLVLA